MQRNLSPSERVADGAFKDKRGAFGRIQDGFHRAGYTLKVLGTESWLSKNPMTAAHLMSLPGHETQLKNRENLLVELKRGDIRAQVFLNGHKPYSILLRCGTDPDKALEAIDCRVLFTLKDLVDRHVEHLLEGAIRFIR
jgi:hypothetical protein